MSMLGLLIFPAFMAFAAFSDMLTMRISNKIILGLIVSFVILAMIVGMPLSLFGVHVGIALLVLIVSFILFSLGWVGGGDAKLAAVTALWFGPYISLVYLIYGALFGGALTLVFLGVRMIPIPAQLKDVVWINRLHSSVSGIPYGIALAAAGLLVYPQSVIFIGLIG
ncbi:MAG: prepilin peptidase [Devosiaceae bacterium]|nr:prepilin peptidase [Devosiaceae bacterium]